MVHTCRNAGVTLQCCSNQHISLLTGAMSTGMLTEAASTRLQQGPVAPWQQALKTLPGKLLQVLLCRLNQPKPDCAGSIA